MKKPCLALMLLIITLILRDFFVRWREKAKSGWSPTCKNGIKMLKPIYHGFWLWVEEGWNIRPDKRAHYIVVDLETKLIKLWLVCGSFLNDRLRVREYILFLCSALELCSWVQDTMYQYVYPLLCCTTKSSGNLTWIQMFSRKFNLKNLIFQVN